MSTNTVQPPTSGSERENLANLSSDDEIILTQTLVQINSAVPSGGSPGPGETEIALYIKAWLEHRDIETHWIEPTKGRPSVVGVIRGTGGGKSLMLNGHIDTVTLSGYSEDPLSGHIENGNLYGRGSADMKCGVAAALTTLARIKAAAVAGSPLRGDVIFTAVADEEDLSIGTEDVLKAGWRADAAVIMEPSNLAIVNTHKGFMWVEINVHGVAGHGSRPDLGIDAISKAGYLLVELDKYARRLLEGPKHPVLGTGTAHTSIIKGGQEPCSYPAKCTITLERRTVPGETNESVRDELEAILTKLAVEVPDFKYDLRITFSRQTFEIDQDHSWVSLVQKHVETHTTEVALFRGEAFWTDCALLDEKKIPVVIYGPTGEGLHSKKEWVEVKSITTVANTLTSLAKDFCQ